MNDEGWDIMEKARAMGVRPTDMDGKGR